MDTAPDHRPAPVTPTATDRTTLMTASLPLAAAIGVFGVIYGAAAQPLLGTALTVISSMIIFSGAAQFTMIALLTAGATPVGVLAAAGTLAIRHVPLAALLRPRTAANPLQRALVSVLMIDETAGLAVTRAEPVERTLVVSGGWAYLAWVAGTVAGTSGASLTALEPLAEALFPVLFIGLASLTASSRGDVARAVLAGAGAVVTLFVVPGVGVIGAVAIALLVATLVVTP